MRLFGGQAVANTRHGSPQSSWDSDKELWRNEASYVAKITKERMVGGI